MKKIWLLGFPLGHSLSPVFQNAGFEHLGLALKYELRPVQAEELAECVEAIRCGRAGGANVTLPWKREVVGLVDELSPVAERAGAVNTLVNERGRVVGHNTDVSGLMFALERQGVVPGLVRCAVVLGAGGAARAAVVTLEQLGVEEIVVMNRSPGRARELVESLQVGSLCGLRAVGFGDESVAWESVELVVQATSLGVGAVLGDAAFAGALAVWRGLPWERMGAGCCVQDLCYGVGRTPFLEAAQERGVGGADGLEMLLAQGMDAFCLWTGRNAPEEVMRAALMGVR